MQKLVELENGRTESLIANIGFYIAENGPSNVWVTGIPAQAPPVRYLLILPEVLYLSGERRRPGVEGLQVTVVFGPAGPLACRVRAKERSE